MSDVDISGEHGQGPGFTLHRDLDLGHHLFHDDRDQELDEEAKYREQELRKNLNGLEDFSDDEDEDNCSEMCHDSMFNSKHCPDLRKAPDGDFVSNETDMNDFRKLKELYQVRVREVKRLSEDLKNCERKAEENETAYSQALAIAEADKQRLEISLRENQKLLISSNERISELEKKMMSLNHELTLVNEKNDQLSHELNTTTSNLLEAQRRLQTSKLNKESVQTADSIIKAQQDRFKETIDNLEKELSKMKFQLEEKENNCLKLEKKYRNLEQEKDNILLQKGDVINKLAMNLEESQKSNSKSIDLKQKIAALTIERKTSELQMKDLGNKLENTTSELVSYKNKCIRLQEDMLKLHSILELDDSKALKELAFPTSNTNYTMSSQSTIFRVLFDNRQMYTEKIQKLNNALAQKEQIVERLSGTEKMLKKEIGKLKEESIKQNNNLEIVESNYKDLENKYSNLLYEVQRRKSIENCSSGDLIKENNRLSYELSDSKKQVEEYKNMYIEIRSDRDKLMNELNDLKSNTSNPMTDAKIEMFSKECSELQAMSRQLNQRNDDLQTKITVLSAELETSKNLIIQLNSEIELHKHKDLLIEELKEKAKEFEKYIMGKIMNHKNTSTSTSDLISTENHIDIKHTEKENTSTTSHKKNVFEDKTNENDYNSKINKLFEEFSEKELMYRKNILILGSSVEEKTKELMTLLEVLSNDRKKYQELEVQKNTCEGLLEKCKQQLHECKISNEKLKQDIENNSDGKGLRKKLIESEKEIAKLKDKYRTIKKTMAKYKEYVNEKDKHVESEMKRIKQNYEESIKKMKEKLDVCISRKEQELNLKITEIETHYSETVKSMKSKAS